MFQRRCESEQNIVVLKNDFSIWVRPDCSVHYHWFWVVVSQTLNHVRSKTWACPTCKRLQHVESLEVIVLLKHLLDSRKNFVMNLLVKVLVAKCPVISTASLFEVCHTRIISPIRLLISVFKTRSNNFGFHVNQYCICWNFSILMSLEVSGNDFFLYEVWTFLGLNVFNELVKESLTNLISALTNLNSN